MVKAAFGLRSGELIDDQSGLRSSDEVGYGTEAEPAFAGDAAPRKALADILVGGHAKNKQEAESWPIELIVSGRSKRLAISANRADTRFPIRRSFLTSNGAALAQLGPSPQPESRTTFPSTFDFSVFNVAPVDQQVERIETGFPVGLVGLVGDGARAYVPMPRLRPYVFVRNSADENPRLIAMRCDTAFVQTDDETLTLTFRGELEGSGADLSLVMLTGVAPPAWAEVESQLSSANEFEALDLTHASDAEDDESEQTVALSLSEAEREGIADGALSAEERTILEELSVIDDADIVEEGEQRSTSEPEADDLVATGHDFEDENSFAGSRFTDSPLERGLATPEPGFADSDEPPPTPRNGVKLGADGFAPLGSFVLSSGQSSPLPSHNKPERQAPMTPQGFVDRLDSLAATMRTKVEPQLADPESTMRIHKDRALPKAADAAPNVKPAVSPPGPVVVTPADIVDEPTADDLSAVRDARIAEDPLSETVTLSPDEQLASPASEATMKLPLFAPSSATPTFGPRPSAGAAVPKRPLTGPWQGLTNGAKSGALPPLRPPADAPSAALPSPSAALPSPSAALPPPSARLPAPISLPVSVPRDIQQPADLLPLMTYAAIKVGILQGTKPVAEVLHAHGVSARQWKTDELRRVEALAAAAKAGDTGTVVALREAMAIAMRASKRK